MDSSTVFKFLSYMLKILKQFSKFLQCSLLCHILHLRPIIFFNLYPIQFSLFVLSFKILGENLTW